MKVPFAYKCFIGESRRHWAYVWRARAYQRRVSALFYFGVKGYLVGLVTFGAVPLVITHFDGDAKTLQLCGILTASPWATKTVIGAISDRFPVMGYYKRVYIIGFLSVLVAVLVAMTTVGSNIDAALGLLTLASLCASSADILGEGTWTEAIINGAGSDLSSFVWGLTGAGTGVAAVLVGFLGKQYILQLFVSAAIFPVAILCCFVVPTFWEDIIPNDRAYKATTEMRETLVKRRDATVKAPPSAFIETGDWVLATTLTISAFVIIGLGIQQSNASIRDDYSKFVGSTITSVSLTILVLGTNVCILVLNHGWSTLESMITAWMVIESFAINGQSAIDYFFLSPDSCLPGGPNFSYGFYITLPAIAGSLTCLLTSAVFAKYGMGYTTRGVCQFAVLLRIVGSAIGEVGPTTVSPDAADRGVKQRLFFFLGVAGIYTAGAMLLTLSLTTFVSNLVKTGRSTYEFSILVSFANLGTAAARLFGLVSIQGFYIEADIDGSVASCNFDYYTSFLVLTRIVMPFAGVVASYVLLPPAFQRMVKHA